MFKLNSNGYVLFDVYSLIPEFDDIVRQIKQDTNSEYPIGTAGPGGGRVIDGWRKYNSIKTLATHPRILDLLETYYDKRPIPFQTLNFMKGTEQATHSDTIHFNPETEGYMCGVWIALEDIDYSNGPLHVYNGSHNEPVYQFHDFDIKVKGMEVGKYEHEYSDFDSSYKRYEQIIDEKMKSSPYEYEELCVDKGTMVIWDANLFHGGTPVKDRDRTRWSQVTHYFFEPDTKFSQPRLSHVPSGDIVWRTIEPIT